jgi:hypothetical protein
MKLATPLTATFAAFATAKKPDNSNECAVTDGRVQEVAYRYYSNGPNCAKNSDLGVIESSIYYNLQLIDSAEIPNCRCVKFDRGGAWDGWLMYGMAGKVDLTRYCGQRLDGELEWDCSGDVREL